MILFGNYTFFVLNKRKGTQRKRTQISGIRLWIVSNLLCLKWARTPNQAYWSPVNTSWRLVDHFHWWPIDQMQLENFFISDSECGSFVINLSPCTALLAWLQAVSGNLWTQPCGRIWPNAASCFIWRELFSSRENSPKENSDPSSETAFVVWTQNLKFVAQCVTENVHILSQKTKSVVQEKQCPGA